jgi:hypothetical protein
MAWLRSHQPHLYWWYTRDPRPRFKGITDAAYYIEHIRRLREYVEPEDFDRVVGIRFAAYLESNDEETDG